MSHGEEVVWEVRVSGGGRGWWREKRRGGDVGGGRGGMREMEGNGGAEIGCERDRTKVDGLKLKEIFMTFRYCNKGVLPMTQRFRLYSVGLRTSDGHYV